MAAPFCGEEGAVSEDRSELAPEHPTRKRDEARDTQPRREHEVCTWQDCQPCRVKGDPDRVTRQARILPRVLKGDIP